MYYFLLSLYIYKIRIKGGIPNIEKRKNVLLIFNLKEKDIKMKRWIKDINIYSLNVVNRNK